MPRLVTCHRCAILQRIPDVSPKTPMIPARLEWTTGESFIYTDDDGNAVMVPAYDPILEDFVEKHNHGVDERYVVNGQVIGVWSVDQKTWDSIDVVTKIKTELRDQTQRHYEEQDEYKEAALRCYNAHGNPDITSGCRDYMDDSKRLGSASYDDGDGHTINIPPQFRQYLCYVCPFQQTAIQVELRRKRGLYDDRKNIAQRAKRRKLRR